MKNSVFLTVLQNRHNLRRKALIFSFASFTFLNPQRSSRQGNVLRLRGTRIDSQQSFSDNLPLVFFESSGCLAFFIIRVEFLALLEFTVFVDEHSETLQTFNRVQCLMNFNSQFARYPRRFDLNFLIELSPRSRNDTSPISRQTHPAAV